MVSVKHMFALSSPLGMEQDAMVLLQSAVANDQDQSRCLYWRS